MSKLEELIQQYCPDGVEYKTLEEVCEFRAGWGFPEVEQGLTEGKYPFYKVGDMNNSEMYMDTANNYISEETSKKLKCKPAPKGTIIFPKIGATMNTNKKRILTKPSCYDNNVMGLIAKSVNDRFLYYFFSQYKLIDFAKGTGAVPSLDTNRLKKLLIPIPPLPVQENIVRVLDTFTELQAELQKRLQQYNYYRDNLLTNFTPDKQVKEYSLGELGTFTRGNGLQKKDFTETGIGCIHYGQIYTRYGAFTEKTLTYVDDELASHLLQVEKGDLVIACTSENVEDICKCVAWLGEENICTGGHACVFRHKQNPKYISYFFQTEYFFNQKVKYTYGTKVKDIKPESLAKIKILLPSLEEQERIVSILDNLYTLTTDLSQGLPAEIEKRRQQYEFYRDKLLTFKRKEA